MSHDSDERSVSQNRPIELFTITTPTATYRHTSHPLPVSFGGNLFSPLTMDRGTSQLSNDQGVDEQTLELPISHQLVQDYAGTGLPDLVVTVTIQRLQTKSGTAQQIFTGVAQSMSVDGRTATIRVPASTADALKIQLPVVGATRICNHRLFDSRCSPNPGGRWPLASAIVGSGGPRSSDFTIFETITAISADGLTITTNGTQLGSNPNGWAALGRLLLLDGSENQRRILTHIGSVITLAVPVPGLIPTAGILIEAGCLHDINTCKSKFNNQLNFGGHPLMTTFNAWQQNGLGVIQQV